MNSPSCNDEKLPSPENQQHISKQEPEGKKSPAVVARRDVAPPKIDQVSLPDPECRKRPVHVTVSTARGGGAEPPPSNRQQRLSAPNERSPDESGDKNSSGNGDRDENGDGDENGPEASSSSQPTNRPGSDQNWTWDCCQCLRGNGNSFMYQFNCLDCGHNRCSTCDIWRTRH
ncbi:hypothetical protein F4818DRAFT_32629 [Hypoxylon cercidicola]|nr:hypothetical protein F4818DRAFT_32629 [Hypoxylon cercidicola]